MRRQVTVGGLVALALMTGSVVAFAQPQPQPQPQPPAPAECAPAGSGADDEQRGLVPSARAQDDPDADDPEDPADEAPADEDPADEDPTDEDPADDDPADGDPADGDPVRDASAGDEISDSPETGGSGDDGSGDDGPEPGEPAADPAADDSAGEPDPATGAGEPAADPTDADPADTATDPCTGPEATAATALGWGAPAREDGFDGPLDPAWQVYGGTGFDGQGTRTTEALAAEDGILTITGDAEGATGGMAWGPGQMYGRWEARVRTPASDPSYNALLLLWPDDESGAGSEVDFMEMLDPTRQTANGFLHSGGEGAQAMGEVAVDGTQWHSWAVEWTPTSVTAYLDGAEWWRVDDPALLPKGPMHLCVQLDWFPTGEGAVQESSMQVDWVRQYAVDAPAPTDDAAADPAGDTTADEPPADAGDGSDPAAADPDPADPATDDGSDASEGAETGRLSEGAPDAPARPGLVPGAIRAPMG